MTGVPEDHADRADAAAQMRDLLARMNQGRTTDQTLVVLETDDQRFLYVTEARANPRPNENPEPEQEAES